MKNVMMVALLAAAVAFGEVQGGGPDPLAACTGRDEGATCSVTFEDGDHAGVCLKARRDEAPSCMPKPVPPPPGGPAS